MPEPVRPPIAVLTARARWRSAEDQLYPSLISDPSNYQRVIAAVQAVVTELRSRAGDVDALLAAEGAADELLARTCPAGVPVPATLLVAVACGMRDRELSAERERRRRTDVVDAARAAGATWAVIDGPADVTELTEGRRIALHLASGSLVEVTVDPWARGEQFSVNVTPGEIRSFDDREAWLAELAQVRVRIEATRETGTV